MPPKKERPDLICEACGNSFPYTTVSSHGKRIPRKTCLNKECGKKLWSQNAKKSWGWRKGLILNTRQGTKADAFSIIKSREEKLREAGLPTGRPQFIGEESLTRTDRIMILLQDRDYDWRDAL